MGMGCLPAGEMVGYGLLLGQLTIPYLLTEATPYCYDVFPSVDEEQVGAELGWSTSL